MPKNTGMGGNKRKKGKKQTTEDKELVYKGEMEEYGQVTKLLGDGRFECQCCDGVKRVAHVRGKMRKKIWIANGDVILVSLREFEPEKCDVIEKYKDYEVTKLKKAGEIPESIVLPNKGNEESEEIVFEDSETDKAKKDSWYDPGLDKEEDVEYEEEDKKSEGKIEKNEEEDEIKTTKKEDVKDEDEDEKV